MKKLPLLFTLIAVLLCGGCRNRKTDTTWTEQAMTICRTQLAEAAAVMAETPLIPRSYKNDVLRLENAYDWTSGFFPGSLWLMYQLSGDEQFAEAARFNTAKLYEIKDYKGTHDLGFMIYCSYGNQYAVDNDSATAQVIVDAAESLVSRVNPNIGLIRSWDFGKWNYPVIIDNMMNLEMLFWASKHTGNPKYRDAAIRHADLTMKNHFRPDNSSYHVVSYNDDGTIESRGTFQGYADESAWARGQAWGLYGFTMCYRETNCERYLAQAERIADYITNQPNTPEDLVPYWDYDAPDIPNAPRDVSAAAVMASALLELSALTGKIDYAVYAERLLQTLSAEPYLAVEGGNGGFILKHSVGHLPADSEIDVPINYADYYYLEAMVRYCAQEGTDTKKLYADMIETNKNK